MVYGVITYNLCLNISLTTGLLVKIMKQLFCLNRSTL